MKIRELLGENDEVHLQTLRQTGYWGAQGAGCLFYAKSTGRFLVAHRSDAVLEPNTWGTWGGAIDPGEDPLQAVKREVREETGYTGPAVFKHLWTFKPPKGNFLYHNFLVTVPEEFEPEIDWENQGFAWVMPNKWPAPRHPGFTALLRANVL